MWLDVLALAVLAIFAALGARRGALASGLSLASLGVAYAAAIWAAPRFGEVAAVVADAPAWLGIPIAGSAAFLAAYLAMGVVSFAARRLEQRGGDGSRGGGDRTLGAGLGLVRGALLVLLVSWLALWIDALRATGTAPELPEIGPSAAAKLTGAVVEAGVQAAIGDDVAGRLAARMAARPNVALADVQALMEHPGIDALRADSLFWSHVEFGNTDAALNRLSFTRLAYDSSFRHQLGDLGLVDASAVEDPGAFRDALAEVLREVGPRLRGLREDPALQELMQDPEVVEMVQAGDHLGLVAHPGFRDVVARVMDGSD